MIEFDHVSKSFPTGNIILDDVSFVINPQDFVILTGISGAGKTTIARLIIKDLSPSEGIIKIDNQNLSSINNRHLPQLRRKIGLVFQDYKIIPDKTVYENVALALEIIHHPAKLIPERVTHLLELVGIADKSNLFPSQLSGGEQQRAAIARAVVGEPQILFADEPTGNLDDQTAKGIFDLLKSIHELGTTVIMATHNSNFLDDSTHHLHLEKGKITSTPAKTNPRPKKKKVTK